MVSLRSGVHRDRHEQLVALVVEPVDEVEPRPGLRDEPVEEPHRQEQQYHTHDAEQKNRAAHTNVRDTDGVDRAEEPCDPVTDTECQHADDQDGRQVEQADGFHPLTRQV